MNRGLVLFVLLLLGAVSGLAEEVAPADPKSAVKSKTHSFFPNHN